MIYLQVRREFCFCALGLGRLDEDEDEDEARGGLDRWVCWGFDGEGGRMRMVRV